MLVIVVVGLGNIIQFDLSTKFMFAYMHRIMLHETNNQHCKHTEVTLVVVVQNLLMKSRTLYYSVVGEHKKNSLNKYIDDVLSAIDMF